MVLIAYLLFSGIVSDLTELKSIKKKIKLVSDGQLHVAYEGLTFGFRL